MNKKLLLTSYIALSVATLTACGMQGVPTPLNGDTAVVHPAKSKEALKKEAIKAEAEKKECKLYAADWWKGFNDPVLNGLVEGLYTNNFDIATALSRINQARALHGIAEAGYFPSVNVGGNAGRTNTSENRYGGTGAQYNDYSVSSDVSWELDIFGKTRNKVKASEEDMGKADESLKNVMVSVIAEMVTNYDNLRMYQAKLEYARQSLEAQSKIYDLTESQVKNGLKSDADLQTAKQELEAVRNAIPALKTNVDATKNAITTLLGKAPGALDKVLAEPKAIPSSDMKLAIGIPAEVLLRRPDVNMAEHAYSAEIAREKAADAALYPSLKFSGSIGLESLATETLFKSASGIFGLASAISWNIFDAGNLRNQLEQQKEVKNQAYIAYKSTVVNALADVEDSISAFTNTKIAEHSLGETFKAAEKSYAYSESQFKNGTISMIDLLNAKKAKLQAEANFASGKAQSATSLVKLYKSLGGGWESFTSKQKAAKK